ncbi:hypothetical protein C7B79_20975 [Chroococcidiopsis cubana CCALA 043]|uniref:PQQ-dependent sugar dehydrogenase n=1 Tax=Chroococcidiopsis cubana TaxID=171392 RepID=UPI000D06B7BF|nr:PQQ-dependent sugar dehydrogenase [Chroococcidiopsis cubana]PSB61702.1 hypothetical protein C7B79_20975 [Chroococcidiopsis cubana CCALA 043]
MKAKIDGWMKGVGSAIALLAIASCSLTQQPNASTTAQTTSPNLSSSNLNVSDSGNVAVAQGIQKTTVAEGLDHPWSLAWLPDGAMLITERSGQLRIMRDGKLDPTPIAGVPEVLTGGQAGLMEISVHPRFAENRLVYLTYSHGTEQANRTRLARATFDGKSLSNLQIIFEVSPTKSGLQHFGSRIVWLPDSTMLLAIGDGGNPPIQLNGELIRQQAKNRRSRLGKIVRLNDDGSIPQDNPFVKSTDTEPAIWSYGHRNIQGLTFDPANNRVWSTEHGSQGGDEANLVQAGGNHGWPIVTYSREYSGEEITKERSRPGMVDPKLVWTPSIAPSGLAFYSGGKFPQWQGDLFAGGLVSQDVRHIDLDAQGNVVNQQAIEIGQRVRDVRQSPDGLLYVLTDDNNGQLIRLEPTGG